MSPDSFPLVGFSTGERWEERWVCAGQATFPRKMSESDRQTCLDVELPVSSEIPTLDRFLWQTGETANISRKEP